MWTLAQPSKRRRLLWNFNELAHCYGNLSTCDAYAHIEREGGRERSCHFCSRQQEWFIFFVQSWKIYQPFDFGMWTAEKEIERKSSDRIARRCKMASGGKKITDWIRGAKCNRQFILFLDFASRPIPCLGAIVWKQRKSSLVFCATLFHNWKETVAHAAGQMSLFVPKSAYSCLGAQKC